MQGAKMQELLAVKHEAATCYVEAYKMMKKVDAKVFSTLAYFLDISNGFLTDFSASCRPRQDVCHALISDHVCIMLIGASNPMLCPIHVSCRGLDSGRNRATREGGHAVCEPEPLPVRVEMVARDRRDLREGRGGPQEGHRVLRERGAVLGDVRRGVVNQQA